MKIKLTENKQLQEEIRIKLKQNDGYCPCKIIKTPQTKCICQEFKKAPLGPCHCGLYIKIQE